MKNIESDKTCTGNQLSLTDLTGSEVILCILLFVFLTMTSELIYSSEEVFKQARLAEEFLEAKDIRSSLETYDAALDEAEAGWQQSSLQYNKGNAIILSGDIGEALRTYNQVPQSSQFSELSARIALNTAIGEIVRAETIAQSSEEKDGALERIHIGLWREAVDATVDAAYALCARNEAMGAHQCIPMEDVVALQQISYQGLADAIEKTDRLRIDEMTPEDGLPYLQLGVMGLSNLVRVMATPKNDATVLSRYQEFYLSTYQEWTPLWQNLLKKFSVPPEAFTKAQDSFSAASTLVSKGDFLGAKQSLETTLRQLQEAMDTLYGGKNVIELLRLLLAGYGQSIARGTVDTPSLQVAQLQMKELEGKIGDKKELSNAFKFLYGLNKTALDMSQEGNEEEAVMFVQGAEIAARMMLTEISGSSPTPKEILKRLIQDQHGLLMINRTHQARGQGDDDRINQLLKHLQKELLVEARGFPDAIKKAGNEQWEKGTFHGLSSVWQDVSTHFDEGYVAAQGAYDVFADEKASSEQTISLQTLAFDDWMTALSLLENMKNREQEVSAKAAAEPQHSKPPPSTSALMQQLESMEQDDKSLSSSLQQVKPEKVEKPW